MKAFTIYYTVKKEDLDELQHVNNVRYVQWVQDIAKQHWETWASKSLRTTYVWVVLSHQITYKASAVLNDNLRICTYVATSEGVTTERIVEFYRESDHKLLVKAKTLWCLLHADRKKPCRIPDDIYSLFHE